MSGLWLFLGLVFLAVFVLAQGTVVPVFGEATQMRKRLLARLDAVADSNEQAPLASLLREKYVRELSPFARAVETAPAMARLSRLIDQCGESTPVYQVVGLSLGLAALGGGAAWIVTRQWDAVAMLAVAGLALPYLRLTRKRAQRMTRFEEQLPDALDVIKRALQAGHPFSQCLKLVSEDMEQPISREFELVFSEVSYGGDVRRAMHGLLERIPSVSVMALVTAVLVQKETGGNLAETMERITVVIRSRFKLARRVRTLSAEGRLSAWILALVPLVLFATMWITTPDYLPMLTKEPLGRKLIMAAVPVALTGILWIRRIIRIQV
jgi:tight adherence protein B